MQRLHEKGFTLLQHSRNYFRGKHPWRVEKQPTFRVLWCPPTRAQTCEHHDKRGALVRFPRILAMVITPLHLARSRCSLLGQRELDRLVRPQRGRRIRTDGRIGVHPTAPQTLIVPHGGLRFFSFFQRQRPLGNLSGK